MNVSRFRRVKCGRTTVRFPMTDHVEMPSIRAITARRNCCLSTGRRGGVHRPIDSHVGEGIGGGTRSNSHQRGVLVQIGLSER